MAENPTKKCPECLAEVPAKAKKCSHCGSKLPQPTSVVLKLLLILFGIGFFTSIISISSGTSSSSPRPEPTPDYAGSAEVYAELYIERILKSPSTADFCRSGTATDLGENKWKVKSCVDSENSYGAMLRSNWEATMIYIGGDPDNVASWKAEEIIFDGKVVYPAE